MELPAIASTCSSPLLLCLLFIIHLISDFAWASGGHWELLQRSLGVSAMHMQLLHSDRVVVFDRTDFGRSNISLPDGKCRQDPTDQALKTDCTAHSVEYDVSTNTIRPLMVQTDTWCSSATVSHDGRLVQTGGFNDGDRTARSLSPCTDRSCDWVETPNNTALSVRRWYATNQILPDGRAAIVGGRRQFSYEFYPKDGAPTAGAVSLPFLQQTSDAEENNLYPFVHLNVDGNLFIFANNRAILLDYNTNTAVRAYPPIPGGDPRNYPSSGSSVLLPLSPSGTTAEVLICGGAPKGSYLRVNDATDRVFVPALSTCGRITITDPSPSWSMETMPSGRVMGDMVLLPSGDVLLINGAGAGAAGWESGREPVTSPVLYRPDSPVGFRFASQNPSTIPRLYHSTAVLLRDGRVAVGGSNPHIDYKFTGVDFPTELSLEAFSPNYLGSQFSKLRPSIAAPNGATLELGYGKRFTLRFGLLAMSRKGVHVAMVAPSFATHAFSMNQRMLLLRTERAVMVGAASYAVAAVAPASGLLAPPGYYMMFVVNAGIPSPGIWAHIE